VFKKKFPSVGIEIVTLLTGMEKAGVLFRALVENLERLLKSPTTTCKSPPICYRVILLDANQFDVPFPVKVKGQALHLVLVVETGLENLNLNTLLEYFMINNLFEALIKVIGDQETKVLAPDALLALVIFCNYSKHEKKNPYLAQLSVIEDRATLMVP